MPIRVRCKWDRPQFPVPHLVPIDIAEEAVLLELSERGAQVRLQHQDGSYQIPRGLVDLSRQLVVAFNNLVFYRGWVILVVKGYAALDEFAQEYSESPHVNLD